MRRGIRVGGEARTSYTFKRGLKRPRRSGSSLDSMPLVDQYGRSIRDLRISITDRCNYRCVYCRTGTHGPEYAELALSDYLRMARVFVSLGITKIRLTGGEPLLRRDVIELVRQLHALRTLADTPPELAITTNGHLLAEMAAPLKAAGLDRVTVSIDAVDPERFARITRVPNGYASVLEGLRAARRAGLGPVKVNCVLLRGFNEDQVEAFGRFAQQEQVIVRFIEFMPLEEGRIWSPRVVVPLAEVLERMSHLAPFHELPHERDAFGNLSGGPRGHVRLLRRRIVESDLAAIESKFEFPQVRKGGYSRWRKAV